MLVLAPSSIRGRRFTPLCRLLSGKKTDRSSHIKLGDDPADRVLRSTAAQSFKKVKADRVQAVKPDRTSNVQLSHGGDDGDRWTTDAQRAFGWKEGSGAGSKADAERRAGIMRNVRATHFALGDEGGSYETTSKALESRGGVSGEEVAARRADAAARAARLKDGAVVLGSDGRSYSTTNAMPAHGAGSQAVAVKVDTYSTNFELGGSREDFITHRMSVMGQTHPDHSKFIPPKTGKWKGIADGTIKTRGLKV